MTFHSILQYTALYIITASFTGLRIDSSTVIDSSKSFHILGLVFAGDGNRSVNVVVAFGQLFVDMFVENSEVL